MNAVFGGDIQLQNYAAKNRKNKKIENGLKNIKDEVQIVLTRCEHETSVEFVLIELSTSSKWCFLTMQKL